MYIEYHNMFYGSYLAGSTLYIFYHDLVWNPLVPNTNISDSFLHGILIFILQHVVLAIKFIIRVAISEVPEWVSVEMAKLEFSRREALRVSVITLTSLYYDKNKTIYIRMYTCSPYLTTRTSVMLVDHLPLHLFKNVICML